MKRTRSSSHGFRNCPSKHLVFIYLGFEWGLNCTLQLHILALRDIIHLIVSVRSSDISRLLSENCSLFRLLRVSVAKPERTKWKNDSLRSFLVKFIRLKPTNRTHEKRTHTNRCRDWLHVRPRCGHPTVASRSDADIVSRESSSSHTRARDPKADLKETTRSTYIWQNKTNGEHNKWRQAQNHLKSEKIYIYLKRWQFIKT